MTASGQWRFETGVYTRQGNWLDFAVNPQILASTEREFGR